MSRIVFTQNWKQIVSQTDTNTQYRCGCCNDKLLLLLCVDYYVLSTQTELLVVLLPLCVKLLRNELKNSTVQVYVTWYLYIEEDEMKTKSVKTRMGVLQPKINAARSNDRRYKRWSYSPSGVCPSKGKEMLDCWPLVGQKLCIDLNCSSRMETTVAVWQFTRNSVRPYPDPM